MDSDAHTGGGARAGSREPSKPGQLSTSNLRPAAALALVCFLLVGVTLAVYWPVLHYPFINYDDTVYVSENPTVQQGLTRQTIVWAFTSIDAAFWHPLTWLSHILDWQLYGTNAGGHHLTSLLFHIANTLLLFLVLRQMTGAFWRSGVVAALFALHPLHVESVAWVAERKDVLSTFFFLLTLWAYAGYADKQKRSRARDNGGMKPESVVPISSSLPCYCLAVLFFILGLMSKPMLVTLPFVLLLLDYWPLERFQSATLRRLLFEKLPFLALTVAACVLAYITEHQAGAVRSLAEVPLPLRLANALTSYLAYLRKLFWPDDLAVFYPFPVSVSNWEVIAAALVLAGISVAAVILLRRRSYFAVGWFFYLGTLVPVIGLVPVGIHSMADRYTYIPLIGVFILIAWAAAELLSTVTQRRGILSLSAALALAGCAAATTIQLRHWRTDAALFAHALAVTKNNVVAHCHLALSLAEQGKDAEAAQQYATALQINPAYPDVNYNLGNFHRRQGRLDEAAAYYQAELRINPRHALSQNNLGILLASQNKTNQAVKRFEAALKIQPDNADAHNNLAILLAAQGDSAAAQAHYLAALHSRPAFLDAHLNLARLYEEQNQLAPAADLLTAGLRLKPDNLNALERLSRVLAGLGRTNEAAVHEQAASKIRRDLAAAHNRRGIALAQAGRNAEAIAEFTRALEAGSDPAETHKNLGLACSLQTNAAAAVIHYREALRARPDFPEVLNNLAWILATQSNPDLRQADEALRLALHAAKLTRTNDAPTLDTLAAAYAEAGQFTQAVSCAQFAIQLAQRGAQRQLASQISGRLQLYQAQQPYRE